MKTSFSGHAVYSIVCVFVMQSKVMLMLRKVELKIIFIKRKIEKLVIENKRGPAAPSAPPLESAYDIVLFNSNFEIHKCHLQFRAKKKKEKIELKIEEGQFWGRPNDNI